jgi:hypothetical protein
MKTIDEWYRSEELRTELAALLEKSPLKDAIEVCLSTELNLAHTPDARADLVHQAALHGASRDGFLRAFRVLNTLTTAPTKPEAMPEPWAHVGAR